MDFKSSILTILSDNVPELDGKIQAGAVDEKTTAPFATFTTPEEKPVRTLSGVAGYETTFELAVYHNRFAGAEELKRKVIRALDSQTLDGKCCRFRSAQSDYFPQYDLHSYTLTFRII
ncbi:MAG: DUF3168 domain-containing protein [Arthrobacter koreensis]